MHARELQFETLRALTIMLEVEGAVEEVWSMSSLPNDEFSYRRLLIVTLFVCFINNFFVSFEISGGSYNPSQNTLRLINKFEKCIPSFMESLIADFIQFSSAIAKFLFLQGRLGTRLCVHSISWFYHNFLIF